MSADMRQLSRRDIRTTASYREAQDFFVSVRQPGTGQINDAADVHAAPDGSAAVFTGHMLDTLEAAPRTHVCHVDLATGETRVLTPGPHVDRHPKFSPDGRQIAFLSDRHRPGDFQLHLLDPRTGATRSAPHVDGWVEYLHWSPDGTRILLGVAGHGADIAGAQGAIATKASADDLPAWVPAVDSGDDKDGWRHAWLYSLADDAVRRLGPADRNVWEATWCGSDGVAAVISSGPGEGSWYGARLALLALGEEAWRDLLVPADQLGWPAASPSGRHLAIVEAVCSDRWIVAGEVRLIDTVSQAHRVLDIHGVDATYLEWRSEQQLLVAGHRGAGTVVGLCDTTLGSFHEIWSSDEIGTTGRYAAVSGFGADGDCVLLGEGFRKAPEIATIRRGEYRSVRSFDLGYARQAAAIAAVEQVHWKAPDGLPMHGWLLRPHGAGPYPLVMNIHGGPILQWHALWLGRSRYAPLCMLLRRGYAIFLPNPRGSSGWGGDFARRVVGDMGGADARDLLSGIDHLVHQGIADPDRLGVTGVSYGGFMTSWLITQDDRFAAAIPIAPITNHVTERLLSNIPHFVEMFVDGRMDDPASGYFRNSPLLHAHKVTTPTLNICGTLDRCTPPEEAIQFHNALLGHGVTSVLANYPQEGHGIHSLPAAIDFAARVVDWFGHFMPAGGAVFEETA